jgi:hypothetical protein
MNSLLIAATTGFLFRWYEQAGSLFYAFVRSHISGGDGARGWSNLPKPVEL